MVHMKIGSRHVTVQTPQRPTMLGLASGAAKLGLSGKAVGLGARAMQLGAKGAMARPGMSARALSWATRGTPRWPWERGAGWSAQWQPAGWTTPWRRRRAAGWLRMPAMLGLGGALAWRRGAAMPWQRRRGMMWQAWAPTIDWRRAPQPMPWFKRRWALLGGLAVGALLMYLFDVEQGNRRRKMMTQRGGRLIRQCLRSTARMGRKLGSDMAGKRQALLHRGEGYEQLDDATLAHKVESMLFRDPHVPKGNININAEHGVIVIRGQVDDPTQMARIEQTVRRIDGVHEVHSLLHTADSPAPNKPAF